MKISLNSILIIIVLVVLAFFFWAEKNGTYLGGAEKEVYALIAVTLASLLVNRRFKNEFLEILTCVFVLFYICRIPFVFSEDLVSDVVLRNVDVRDIHRHMAVLVFQYSALVSCILVINPRIPRPKSELRSATLFKRILRFGGLIVLINVANIVFVWQYNAPTVTNLVAILETIFPLEAGLMLIILSATMVSKEMLAKHKVFVILCCFVGVNYFLYAGNKSGLLQIVLVAYLARVVVHGPVILRLRDVLLTAILGALSFLLFFVGSGFRFYQRGEIGVDEIWDRSFGLHNSAFTLLNAFSYRIGYLDFFIERVSNPIYRPLVNFKYYFMSLTDKMTPGFDVFNVPFLSRTIYNTYFGQVSEGTNSDQITLFAESHLLLGFFSFVMYLMILFVMKRAIVGYRPSSEFACVLYHMYVVGLFYSWVVGFGLDMVIAELVYKGIFVICTIWFLRFRLDWGVSNRLAPAIGRES